MTKQQFIKAYAARSGLTPEYLKSVGMVAEKCECDEPSCKGWAFVYRGKIEKWTRPVRDIVPYIGRHS